jgi:hypothetical protein
VSVVAAIVVRNLRLFFRDRLNAFFSLLGAIILFALYTLFLGNLQTGRLEDSFPNAEPRKVTAFVDSCALTLASNGENDVGCAARSYFGGRSDANALSTVDRPIPSCLATCRCGTPSATSRRINAQSSTEITHPICLGGLVFARR